MPIPFMLSFICQDDLPARKRELRNSIWAFFKLLSERSVFLTIDFGCSILYQRGIYSAESFEAQLQYGLTMMVTTDPGLTKYLTSVHQQMSGVTLCFRFSCITL